jgi:DNA-binding response OmpR family regulator
MSAESPNILLLEDTRTVQNYVRDVLRSLEFSYELLVAKRVDDAAQLAEQNEIDLFIVDIGLPDGDGIDFLCAMAAVHPSARALVITGTPSDFYRDRARAIGVLNILPKPLQRKTLLDAVTALLSQGQAAGPEPVGFEGTLGGLSPADIIQLKCLRQASGVIEFSNEDRFGLVWFEEGEITHAECDCLGEHHTGIEAFRSIVSWRTGTVREVPQPPGVQRSITKSWQALLMEATPST